MYINEVRIPGQASLKPVAESVGFNLYTCHAELVSASTLQQSVIQVRDYYVYIMASAKRGTLYIGVTNDLVRRLSEHKQGSVKGFTKKYKVHMLVYYEQTTEIYAAITREKQLKNWHRDWKFNLIESMNLDWHDLYTVITGTVDAETSSA